MQKVNTQRNVFSKCGEKVTFWGWRINVGKSCEPRKKSSCYCCSARPIRLAAARMPKPPLPCHRKLKLPSRKRHRTRKINKPPSLMKPLRSRRSSKMRMSGFKSKNWQGVPRRRKTQWPRTKVIWHRPTKPAATTHTRWISASASRPCNLSRSCAIC